MNADAQKYNLSEQATGRPQTGVTYAIMNSELYTYISCKYGSNGGLLSILEDDDVLWQIEATGEQTEAGYDLYYLFSVGQQLYVQEVDLEGNPDLDGYDVFAYNGFNFELGDKSGAAKITIEKGVPQTSDVADGEAWRTNGPSSGYVLARQNVVYKSDGTPWYMKFGVQNTNVAFEPYNESVGWQFWTVEEMGPLAELEALIDNYSGTEYLAGTDPGYYESTAVEEYNTALETALLLTINTGTDEQYQAAIDELRAKHEAVEAAAVPITSDYYYMVSGFDDFLNNFGVEKAAYANSTTNTLYYRTFDEDDVEFVFHIEPATDENEYWVQDYSTGLYVAKGTAWYNSSTSVVTDMEEPQNIRLYTPGKWYWGSRTYHNTSYTPYASSAPVASDSNGQLTSWGQWSDDSTVNTHFNLWYIRRVPSDKMATFVTQKEQADLDATAKSLANEASTLYGNLFSYSADYDSPLITRASGGYDEDPADDNQITFSNIRRQGLDTSDKYEFLIDGDSVTYMQGSGSIYIKLANPVQNITFVYKTRGGNANQQTWGLNERPKLVNLYGYNTTLGETDYGSAIMESVDMSAIEPHTVNLGKAVDRVQYEVLSNYNNGSYFTLGDFQMYQAVIDEATSQYYTTEGLQTAAEAMQSKANEALTMANAGTTTSEVIEELRAAIAAVEDLYADTLVLSELVEECTTLATTVTTGTGVGESSDSNAGPTLLAAAEAAKPYISASTDLDDLKEAIATLQEAKAAFMATIKMFEEGKFYYITSASDGDWAGLPMYTALPTTSLTSGTNNIRVDLSGEDYTNSANHMYRFVATEKGTYYIQNLATGFYLPAYAAANSVITASQAAAEFNIEYVGYSGFTFTSTSSLNGDDCAIGIIQGDTIAHTNDGLTAWKIVGTDDVEAIYSKRFSFNTEGVMSLPYDLTTVDINDDFHMYGIKSITQEEDAEGNLVSTIEFYEKESAAANEAVFYRWGTVGTTDDVVENYEFISAMPTDVTNTMEPANGIVGTLYSQAFGAGVAYFNGTETKVTTTSTTIAYQLGVINPAYYSGEVEGVETAFTMTLTGLNALPSAVPGDVNGDGEVTAADAVSVYNYVTNGEDSGITGADVNGDGEVNSADAVTVYNYIVQGS